MNDIVALDACSVSTLTESPAAATLEELPHRVRDIATLRGLGYTFREISEQFGVTPQAISLMLSRHRRVLKTLRGAVELAAPLPRQQLEWPWAAAQRPLIRWGTNNTRGNR